MAFAPVLSAVGTIVGAVVSASAAKAQAAIGYEQNRQAYGARLYQIAQDKFEGDLAIMRELQEGSSRTKELSNKYKYALSERLHKGASQGALQGSPDFMSGTRGMMTKMGGNLGGMYVQQVLFPSGKYGYLGSLTDDRRNFASQAKTIADAAVRTNFRTTMLDIVGKGFSGLLSIGGSFGKQSQPSTGPYLLGGSSSVPFGTASTSYPSYPAGSWGSIGYGGSSWGNMPIYNPLWTSY